MTDRFYRLEYRCKDDPNTWIFWADCPLNKSGRVTVISAYNQLEQSSKILEARILVCNPVEHFCKEEDENGREEIARPCEFCDGKHAVPYEKNGQMLTPYQETFRTKLFIGDLPWAGKTLFVRSYYCPTYGDSYCNGPRMDSFQINFCPHCGRDLRGDRKDGRG